MVNTATRTNSGGIGGIGLGGAVFIVFLVLKLTGNINWSWWWVTAPLWAPLGFIATVLVLVGLFTVIAALVHGSSKTATNRRPMRRIVLSKPPLRRERNEHQHRPGRHHD